MKFRKAFDEEIRGQLKELGFHNIDNTPTINKFAIDYSLEAYSDRKTGDNVVGVSVIPSKGKSTPEYTSVYVNLSQLSKCDDAYILPKGQCFTSKSTIGRCVIEVAKSIAAAETSVELSELFVSKAKKRFLGKMMDILFGGTSIIESSLEKTREFINANSFRN
jgi:hypothetical protein